MAGQTAPAWAPANLAPWEVQLDGPDGRPVTDGQEAAALLEQAGFLPAGASYPELGCWLAFAGTAELDWQVQSDGEWTHAGPLGRLTVTTD